MKKAFHLFWSILVFTGLITTLVACGLGGMNGNPPSQGRPSTPPTGQGEDGKPPQGGSDGNQGNPHEAPSPDPIRQRIDEMSMEEKIGQILLVGFEGKSIGEDEKTKAMIDELHVGGLILYARNVEESSQLRSLLNDLKEENRKAHGEAAIPLFLSVDEEGGRITRMPQAFTSLPTNRAIGKVHKEGFSYEVGKVIAKEISAFGYNMDFAPVLDINSNPKNPVIGDRSFGNRADLVTALGVKTMEGIRDGGVIPVVKHFPGHGDTSVDSHIGLPKVNKKLSDLTKFELLPFQAAIQKGADVVMIAHILLPKIDPDYPSSLSKKIISDLLRDQMGYQGVVITDDLTMGAIAKHYSLGKAAVQSFLAGSDILLVAHQYENAKEVYQAMKTAVEEGKITEERLNQSVYRILNLKEKYRLSDQPAPEVQVAEINRDIEGLLRKYLP